MEKKKKDLFAIILGGGAVSAVVWLPAAGLQYVFNYLTDYYYLYLKWPLDTVFLITAVVWVAALIWYYVKAIKIFYVLKDVLIVILTVCCNLILFFISDTIYYNLILAIPAGFYVGRRCEALNLKMNNVYDEVVHLSRIHMAAVTVTVILYIVSKIMIPGFVVYYAELLSQVISADSILYIAAFVVIMGLALCGAGVMLLYRAILMRCAYSQCPWVTK